MLPEIGATELMVIAAVALIVVGPKDLPVLLRKLGRFVAKLRGMANDFRSSFDEMARQSELDDLRKEVAAMRAGQYTPSLDDGQVTGVFDEIDAELRSPPSYDPFSAADYPSPDTPSEDLPKPRRTRKTVASVIEAPPAPAPAKARAKSASAKAKPAAKTPAAAKSAAKSAAKPAAAKPAAKPAAKAPAKSKTGRAKA